MSIQELIVKRSHQVPDDTFLIAPESGENVTYAELHRRARLIDATLNAMGCPRGEHVALLMDNGAWTASLLLGVMASGRVAVSLNAIAGESQLEYVLGHCDASFLLASEQHLERARVLAENADRPIRVLPVDPSSGLDEKVQCSAAGELPTVGSEQTGLIMYTSGTTGKPKGVVLTHGNLVAGGKCTVEAHALSRHDRALCVLPLYHINAQIVTLVAPLVSGGSVVMPARLSIRYFWSWLLDNQCTWFSIVPTIVAYLLDQTEREHDFALREDTRMQQVRFGRSASSALPAESHKAFEQAFGVPLVETMGLTETAAQILSNPLPPFSSRYGSPGIAYRNEVKVVGEDNQELPSGEIGELVVRGDNVMKEYYKNPEATASTIDADGWLHTGDLGYRDAEGFFFITGRIKELIIKGGENIAPREIDDALLAHPAVLEAAAYAVDDSKYGQDVMAAAVLKEGQAISPQALLDHCHREVGTFKSPSTIHLVQWLPRGPSGKIQRLKIAELLNELTTSSDCEASRTDRL